MKKLLLTCCLLVSITASYSVTNQLILTRSDGTMLMISCDDIRDITFTGQVSIDDQHLIAAIFSMKQNYPNPFNPTTSIEFDLVKSGKAELSIYNSNGQLIKTLINGNLTAGNHKAIWNGTDNSNISVASGTYFYKVTVDDQTQFKKMLMLK